MSSTFPGAVGRHSDLQTQMDDLGSIIAGNDVLQQVLKDVARVGLADYYVAGGCVVQTVWNHQVGNSPMYGISDIDLVYFDDSDLSAEAEGAVIAQLKATVDPAVAIDIKNEARVHLWYKDHFGFDIRPYTSVEDAIATWPAAAFCIGIRLDGQAPRVYAPFGLGDLFGMIVRPNKASIAEDIYAAKAKAWTAKWPSLTVIPW